MERIEEIEAAVERLPAEDYERFAKWFHEREQERWDQQLDRDAAAGKLDFSFEEAGRQKRGSFGDSQRNHQTREGRQPGPKCYDETQNLVNASSVPGFPLAQRLDGSCVMNGVARG